MRVPGRRKRRKEEDEEDGKEFHHTFVMKLFDRSVDLAQFRDMFNPFNISAFFSRVVDPHSLFGDPDLAGFFFSMRIWIQLRSQSGSEFGSSLNNVVKITKRRSCCLKKNILKSKKKPWSRSKLSSTGVTIAMHFSVIFKFFPPGSGPDPH